jgi:hypothetical protein
VWYAKEKGEWEAGKQGGMLESGDGGEVYQEPVPAAQTGTENGSGILSSSTLAALKGYTTASSNKRAAPMAGPLVDYGSDSD